MDNFKNKFNLLIAIVIGLCIFSFNVNSIIENGNENILLTTSFDSNIKINETNLNDNLLELEKIYEKNSKKNFVLLDELNIDEHEKEMIIEMISERMSYLKNDLLDEYKINQDKEFALMRLEELNKEELKEIQREIDNQKERNLKRISNRIDNYKNLKETNAKFIKDIETYSDEMIEELEKNGEMTKEEIDAIKNDKLDELKKTIEYRIENKIFDENKNDSNIDNINNKNNNKNDNNNNNNNDKRKVVISRIKNKNILNVDEFEIKTDLYVDLENYNDDGQIKVQLKDGKNYNLKLMPETAAEIVINNFNLNESRYNEKLQIQLKEIGKKNESRVAYNLKSKRQVKLFGFIKTNINLEVDVDADTSEIISVKNSWWSFLAVK